MQKSRVIALILRWSTVGISLTAGVILICLYSVGDIPNTTLRISEKEYTDFPFIVSRYWDLLIAPIWLSIMIPLLTYDKVDTPAVPMLLTGIFVGAFAQFGLSVGSSLIAFLIVFAFFSSTEQCFHRDFDFWCRARVAIAGAAGVSLVAALICGLLQGIVQLVIGLAIITAMIGLRFVAEFLCYFILYVDEVLRISERIHAVESWLMARDKT